MPQAFSFVPTYLLCWKRKPLFQKTFIFILGEWRLYHCIHLIFYHNSHLHYFLELELVISQWKVEWTCHFQPLNSKLLNQCENDKNDKSLNYLLWISKGTFWILCNECLREYELVVMFVLVYLSDISEWIVIHTCMKYVFVTAHWHFP